MWRHASGKLDSEAFVGTVSTAASAGGPAFESGCWWLEDDELIVWDGRTYAFSKIWGRDTETGIMAMLKAYPNLGISAERSPETE